MDPNAYTTPFQLTKGLHRDVYKTVDPTNPELTATGKTVLITGATGGLGGEIARAWAQAGAAAIVLVGRNEALLAEPRAAIKALSPSTQILSVATDITSEASVAALFEEVGQKVGRVHVVINTAGAMNNGPGIGEIEPGLWWRDFEVNTKGAYNLAHYFIKASGGEGTIINLVSMGASFTVPGISSYSASKLAVIKLGEYLDVEHPKLRVFAVHPGLVAQTASQRGMVVEAFIPFAHDKGMLAGGVTLYLATPRAEHLRGSFISANWDLEEIEDHKKEVVDSRLLKLGFLNAKLSSNGYSWTA